MHSAATSPPAGLGTMSFLVARASTAWATINGGALVELYKVVGSRDHARFVAAAMQLHGLTEGQANDALARFAEEEQWPIPSRTQSGGGARGRPVSHRAPWCPPPRRPSLARGPTRCRSRGRGRSRARRTPRSLARAADSAASRT